MKRGPNVILRDFNPGDSAAVNALALAAFEQYRPRYREWETFCGHIGRTAGLAEQGELIVAEEAGRVVGAVVYLGPGRPKSDLFLPEWAVMRMLVVDPAVRGRGIGRALAEACLRRGERDRARMMALHTSPVMEIALSLYLGMGFVFMRAAPEMFGVAYGVYAKALGAGRSGPAILERGER